MGHTSGKRFTPEQIERLNELVASQLATGSHIAWKSIGSELDHPAGSCKATWNRKRKQSTAPQPPPARPLISETEQPQRKYSAKRSNWTPHQIAIVERLANDARRRRIHVRWDLHVEEIGHPLSSIKSMHQYLYASRRNEEMRRFNRNLRALADVPPSPLADPSNPAPVPKANCGGIDTLRVTSTGRFLFAAEYRERIGSAASITAAQFGDPRPGRSALDEKRAGIVRPDLPTTGTRYPRKPTLATRAGPF